LHFVLDCVKPNQTQGAKMPTVAELAQDVSDVIIEPVEMVKAYARALIDAGDLPKSRGRAVAQVSYRDIVTLLTAVALEPKIKDASQTVAQFLSMDNRQGNRLQKRKWVTAGDWLEQFAAKVLNFDRLDVPYFLLVHEITFYRARPQVIVNSGAETDEFLIFQNPDFPVHCFLRRSATIFGSTFQYLGEQSGRSYKSLDPK
jgi:hypothetical protein